MEPDAYINKIKDINVKMALKILSDNFRANKARIIPVESILGIAPGTSVGSPVEVLGHNIFSPTHKDTYQDAGAPEPGAMMIYRMEDAKLVWSTIPVGFLGQVLQLASGGGGLPEGVWSTELLTVIVRKLQEASGPTNLTLGAVADGQFLKRVGTDIVGAAAGGGSTPTGTGFRHVTAGVEDGASKLVDTADINDDQVTFAKIQNISSDRLLGRFSGPGAGNIEEIILSPEFTIVASTLFLGSHATNHENGGTDEIDVTDLSGVLADPQNPAVHNIQTAHNGFPGGGTTFLRDDGVFAAPAGGSSPLTEIVGNSGAAGSKITWLTLSANSGNITGVVQTVFATITNLAAGTYYFVCHLIYQTTAATTGIDLSVNFTGTSTHRIFEHRFASTGSAATTAAASEATAGGTGNTYEAQGTRNNNSIIGTGTVSVDTANADMLSEIHGFLVVTVSGDLQFKMGAEAAGLTCTARAGTFIELKKVA